jgi:hypothetical protein
MHAWGLAGMLVTLLQMHNAGLAAHLAQKTAHGALHCHRSGNI